MIVFSGISLGCVPVHLYSAHYAAAIRRMHDPSNIFVAQGGFGFPLHRTWANVWVALCSMNRDGGVGSGLLRTVGQPAFGSPPASMPATVRRGAIVICLTPVGREAFDEITDPLRELGIVKRVPLDGMI